MASIKTLKKGCEIKSSTCDIPHRKKCIASSRSSHRHKLKFSNNIFPLMCDQQCCPLALKHFWHKRKQTGERTTTSLSVHFIRSYFNLFKHFLGKKSIPVQHTKGTLWVRTSQLAFHYSTLHPLGILALTSCLCSQTFFPQPGILSSIQKERQLFKLRTLSKYVTSCWFIWSFLFLTFWPTEPKPRTL